MWQWQIPDSKHIQATSQREIPIVRKRVWHIQLKTLCNILTFGWFEDDADGYFVDHEHVQTLSREESFFSMLVFCHGLDILYCDRYENWGWKSRAHCFEGMEGQGMNVLLQ